jgi:hypothetical protein
MKGATKCAARCPEYIATKNNAVAASKSMALFRTLNYYCDCMPLRSDDGGRSCPEWWKRHLKAKFERVRSITMSVDGHLSQPKNLEIEAMIAGLTELNYRAIEMPLRKKGARIAVGFWDNARRGEPASREVATAHGRLQPVES